MKIAVYAIAKNEGKNVLKWLESVKEADGVFVLDTGSSDGTQSMLTQHGAHVTQMAQKPFRFDHARNEAMSLVPADYDVLVSIDFDEQFVTGWRQAIEENFTCDAASYTLVYTHDAEGNVGIAYPRMAVHRRDIGEWQYAVHEIFVVPDDTAVQNIPVQVVHYGEAKEPGHYLDLLKVAYEENPDARTTSYLAREYYSMGNFAMAEPLYKTYLGMEQNAPFRAEAARYIAMMQKDPVHVEWWFRQAIQYCNNIREPYCELAQFLFREGEYEQVIALVRSAMKYPHPDYAMVYNEMYYAPLWCPHMLMAAYQQAGMFRQAVKTMRGIQRSGHPINEALQADITTLKQTIMDTYHVYSDCMGV